MTKTLIARFSAPAICALALAACRLSPDNPHPTPAPPTHPPPFTQPSIRAAGLTASLTPAASPTSTPYPIGTRVPPALSTIDPGNAGRLMEVARLGKGPATAVQFLADGKELGAATMRGMHFYDPASGEETRSFDLGTPIACASFSPDGQWMAGTSVEPFHVSVRIWDTADGSEVRILASADFGLWVVSFSPDGTQVAVGSDLGGIDIFAVGDGTLVRSFSTAGTARVRSVSFSPDGQLLAAGLSTNAVEVWNTADGATARTLEGHADTVRSAAFSPDGALLASGSNDQTVRIWSIADGKPVRTLKGHTDAVTNVAFSPDGILLASGSNDRTVRVWNIAEGKTTLALDGMQEVSFSPVGSLLASSSGEDAIRLWSIPDGVPVRTFRGHLQPVNSIAFSPDGALLAAGGADGIISLWGAPE
jgi:WD40 repeat protein